MRASVMIAAAFAATMIPQPGFAQGSQPATAPPSAVRARIARWFELQNATLNLRVRYIDNPAGTVTTRQLQHRETLRARVKFDASARYSLNLGLFTGARFTSGWDNTGWGLRDAQNNLAFKAAYFAAMPVSGVEAQYGGFYILRGESTELTTYDEDGYLVGQRISIRRPKNLFVDELSATVGYLAPDPEDIPISKRTKYLDDTPNYRHFLVGKKFGTRAGVSGDFTYAAGAKTWREAINVKTPELRVVDTVIFENYQRVNRHADAGFAVTLDKAIRRNVSVNGGYASIDMEYGDLNADRFQVGNRVFAAVIYTISPRFSASAFITRDIGTGVPPSARATFQRTLSNVVFSYNALPDLRRSGLF
jgi:hypothetical protein